MDKRTRARLLKNVEDARDNVFWATEALSSAMDDVHMDAMKGHYPEELPVLAGRISVLMGLLNRLSPK